jgi:ATP-dependent Lon protease
MVTALTALARNEPDLDEVPTHVRDQLDVRVVGDVSDLVAAALSDSTAPADEAHAA